MQKMRTLKIDETFQRTIQGEGFWAGRGCDFIRLYGCPVQCNFCDTGYGEGEPAKPYTERTIDELIDEIVSPLVVISGGEPFANPYLPELVDKVLQTREVAIETSGAIWKKINHKAWVTLSPKDHVKPQLFKTDARMWERANEIKIVVDTEFELDAYEQVLESDIISRNLYLQPEFNEIDRTLPKVLQLISDHPKWRLSIQTHKYIGVR